MLRGATRSAHSLSFHPHGALPSVASARPGVKEGALAVGFLVAAVLAEVDYDTALAKK